MKIIKGKKYTKIFNYLSFYILISKYSFFSIKYIIFILIMEKEKNITKVNYILKGYLIMEKYGVEN